MNCVNYNYLEIEGIFKMMSFKTRFKLVYSYKDFDVKW